jgi:hypothetical protein
VGGANDVYGVGFAQSGTVAIATIRFPVRMRANPAFSTGAGVASNYSLAHEATSTALSILPVFTVIGGTDSAGLTCTVAGGLTTGFGCILESTNAAGVLIFSADY